MLPFDPAELAKYGGLTLVAQSVARGLLSGVHAGRLRGLPEPTDRREYRAGDDPGRIDWRASGRADRLLVREPAGRANRPATVVLDASGSMRYRGAQPLSKFDHARRAAAALAYLLLAQHDAVGLVVHDAAVRQAVPPRTGSKHLLRVLRGLEDAGTGGGNLAAVWDAVAARHLRRPGLVVLISDGFDRPAHLARAWHRLRHRGHEVLFAHVLAPEEIAFPFDGLTKFRDLERVGEVLTVDARRAGEEYRRDVRAYLAEVRDRAGELRVGYVLLRTDEPLDRALGAYLAGRATGRRAGG